jgi:hypothetical protein
LRLTRGFCIGHDDAVDEITRIREAGGGYAGVFGVVKLHAMTDGFVELRGDRLVAHAEQPHLRRDSGDQVLRDLTFLGLAHPSLARELLQNSGPFAVRIRPRQREPAP